jgi:hypothetical protein
MDSRKKMDGERSIGEQEKRMKIRQRSLAHKWREMFRRHRRMHDPMLALNMSIFNFADGWNRTVNPRYEGTYGYRN